MIENYIIKEINAIQDEIRNVERTIDLIYKVQLSKGPLVQLITIIKYEKPRLYAVLKKRFENNLALKMLFFAEVQYESAKASLGM